MIVKFTFEMLEKALNKAKDMIHTSYLTPEQDEQFRKCNAELGKAFLEGRVKIGNIETRFDDFEGR